MANLSKKEQFFPSIRKYMRLAKMNTMMLKGEKRQRLEFIMPLTDGKLIGLPEWLGEPLRIVQNPHYGQSKGISIVELEGMELSVYMNEKGGEVSHSFSGMLFSNFIIRRANKEESGDEVEDVELAFVAKIPWNAKIWPFVQDFYTNHFYAAFEGRQAKLTFGKPADDDEDEDEENENEMDREKKKDLSPASDSLFAPKPGDKAKGPKLTGPRRVN